MQTHCGMGSMMEAIVSGVPLIGLPFGTDQPEGAAFCELPFFQNQSCNPAGHDPH